ncbi:hypothetical protein B0H15DRAFT_795789 [Mycena belliarum]|uniref:Uncharacterized protein n=1 Tax=Mycena belliarum TaxID=1033014 RepID=A0AAD6UH17_9AGAR|nr:hypothetical protein B0H15DRAFT_795789 [Mycena belliae]
MHRVSAQHYTDPSSSRYRHSCDPDPPLGHVVSSASSVLAQPPPPSLRDILGAYKANGDGDRDMLLAMLNAKSAEDQRLASIAALHRTMLEVYQPPPAPPHLNGSHHHYPTPKFTQSPPLREAKLATRHVYHHIPRSPPYARDSLPPLRAASPKTDHRRKRARSSHSRSPPPPSHSSSHRRESLNDPHSELPPSPYSSSGSDSAGYSPRSRGSMTIGSLLSSGPPREGSGEPPLSVSDRRQGSQS